MSSPVTREDLLLAHELATVAGREALAHVADVVAHDTKDDGTPVSAADRAAEHAMLEVLAGCRPDDGVVSEESGEVAPGRRQWILDPIDGTAQFVVGDPEWGTHVALAVDGEVVLGVVTRPWVCTPRATPGFPRCSPSTARRWSRRGHGC